MVAAGVVLTAVAVLGIQQALPDFRANSALRAAKGALIFAREQALQERRGMEVEFLGTNEIRVSRVNLDGTRSQLRRYFFEGTMTFRVYPALPDTPDAFGMSSAVTFPNNELVFTAQGTAVDASNLPVSGTVFLGLLNNSHTARAVTVFGATGRIAGYRWDGRSWRQM